MKRPKFTTLKTIEACFKAEGIDLQKVPDMFAALPEHLRQHYINDFILTVCFDAVNEGWVADWTNIDEPKYRPYYLVNKGPGGFRLSFDDYGFDGSLAGLGARQVCKTREQAAHMDKYFITQFENWYFKRNYNG